MEVAGLEGWSAAAAENPHGVLEAKVMEEMWAVRSVIEEADAVVESEAVVLADLGGAVGRAAALLAAAQATRGMSVVDGMPGLRGTVPSTARRCCPRKGNCDSAGPRQRRPASLP